MPHRDLVRLVAYFQLEPFPDASRDAAQLCAVIANCNRPQGAKPYRVEDFLPRPPGAGKKAQSTQDMMAAFEMVAGG